MAALTKALMQEVVKTKKESEKTRQEVTTSIVYKLYIVWHVHRSVGGAQKQEQHDQANLLLGAGLGTTETAW